MAFTTEPYQNNSHTSRVTLFPLAFILINTFSGTALAQATVPGALEEVIVTAQKRSELLTEVAMSINAVSGERLQDLGVTDVSQLEAVVPGFSYQLSNYGIPVYTLRGVGFYERTLGNAPAVNVYVDEVPLPYSAMTKGALLDVERLEVLKGPQGTLFGQNSTGGAINYIAAKPSADTEAGIDLTVGSFGQMDFEGYLSGKLTDQLLARVAVRSENRDEWQESWTRSDENGARDLLTGRLLLDWLPSDDLRFELALSGWRDKSDTQAGQYVTFRPSRALASGGNPPAFAALAGNPQGYPTPPTDNETADWDADFDLETDNSLFQGSLRADWNMSEDTTLTSITAYSDFSELTPVDTDSTDFKDQRTTRDGAIQTFFQELRIAGQGGGSFDWMVGGNFGEDQVDELIHLYIEATNNSVGPFRYNYFDFVNNQDVETWAAFGALDYHFTETLTLQSSVRYTTQDRDFEGCLQDAGDGAIARGFTFLSQVVLMSGAPAIQPGECVTLTSPANPVPVDIIQTSLDEDNVSWRFSLNWEPSEGMLVYGNVSEGYKNGSFPSVPGVFAAQYAPVTQESLLAYEVGSKISLAEGRAQLNAAAFYYDYEDKQILGTTLFPIFGPLPILVNIPKSNIKGVEVELTVQPVVGLLLSGSVVYLDSEIEEDPIDPRSPFGVPTSFVGEEFPVTPNWQFIGDAEYQFPLADMMGIAGVHYNYRDSTNATLGEDPLHAIDEYGLLDLRLGLAGVDDQWRVLLWARNLTDEYYWNNAFRSIDTVTRIAGMPRTYGITFSYRFF
jgi:iron complex outermembrane receptor protein